MTDKDKNFLFTIAKKAIIEKDKLILSNDEIKDISGILLEKRGCFVTLTINKALRGCIGYILPIHPLYQAVIDNAYNAAYSDPRFSPVSIEEINKIKIEISILTVPEKIKYSSSDDLLNKLVPLQHGVILKKGFRSSTFLPQVWEQLPDKKEFLNHLCMKAGLKSDEWTKGTLDVETYEAEILEE